MDNISRRHSNEDTTTSMYLSFDAESTMSTACYRTLEAISDISSSNDMDDSRDTIANKETDVNNTIDEHEHCQNVKVLKTGKKKDIPESLALRSLPTNVLQEHKVVSSTPSKERPLKTFNINRGSEAIRSEDLCSAFLGVEDEKSAYFPQPSVLMKEENKENASPDTEEISSFSTCSSVETTTSVIEKKMLTSISTVGSITEEESLEETKSLKTSESNKTSVDVVDRSESIHSLTHDTNKVLHVVNHTDNSKEYKQCIEILEAKIQNISNGENVRDNLEAEDVRRSICEPNLQTSQPPIKKSILPTSRKSIALSVETEIPLLMSKMLKITSASVGAKDHKYKGTEITPNRTKSSEKMRSMKTRKSLIPSVIAKKQPFSFPQNTTVLVKDNSPARKINLKSSVSGCSSSLKRRSVIPQKITTTHRFVEPKTDGVNIIIPMPSKRSLAPVQEMSTKVTDPKRKSFFPTKVLKETKPNPSVHLSVHLSHHKRDISYRCHVCNEKFPIKSLLDAHKRSHEIDNVAPAFVKNPTTTQSSSSTAFENSNKCKYCDKKFALLKALHIHLLQNCMKIPPSQKRKLQYTDLNHVEKAQLPNVFSHHNSQSITSSRVSLASDKPRRTLKRNDFMTKSLSGLGNENQAAADLKSRLTTSIHGDDVSSHVIGQKNKIIAHAGIYKTPSKSVPCHLCKLRFKSILDYTNHNLTTHGNHKSDDASTDASVIKKNFN